MAPRRHSSGSDDAPHARAWDETTEREFIVLQMHVYKEINTLEPKVMWGLTWRQMLAAAIIVLSGGGLWAVFYFLLKQPDVGMYAVFAVCTPIAAYGWWRPQGLKPEVYARYVLRHVAGQSVYLLDGKKPRQTANKKMTYKEKGKNAL